MKVIISGGGTGGHVFPAIAIAHEIKSQKPTAEIMFVGAEGKIEMEKVPKAGYPIKGLWISGFQRKLSWRNLTFPFKLLHSLWKARQIISRFRPDVVIGVGGYASGPTLEMATRRGIPTLIQEQNSYPGVTNRLLAKKVSKICVAYSNVARFFPKEKIVLTGNPVRADIRTSSVTKTQAQQHFFGTSAVRPTIFIFGGSLGARTINEAVAAHLSQIKKYGEVQILWQVGKGYIEEFERSEVAQLPQVKVVKFVDRMDLAYELADVIIGRAGALTISELCIIGKPAILVPSPNVAEDHQTANARALVDAGAAVLVKDSEAKEQMLKEAFDILADSERQSQLSQQIKTLAKPNATKAIVGEVRRLVGYI
ncbi:MAG: undecaprenyldiphospho-muramoylpentapeptide beta-N-acetylglucosaminyltransferase [Bacteroidota bacterium]